MSTIRKLALDTYLGDLSAKTSTPGGGAVAAIASAEGCALIAMVTNFTKDPDGNLQGLLQKTASSIDSLLDLADADAIAFDAVMKAYRGEGDLAPALIAAAEVPLQVIAICEQHVTDVELLLEYGNPNLLSDVAIAAMLLRSGFDASEINVLINARSLEAGAEDLRAGLASLPTQRARLDAVQSRIKAQLA